MILTNASAKAIRYACETYHYSGSVPSVQYGYNFYNAAGEWCGVVCFGGGANNHIGCPYGLYPGEILELVRVALNGKQQTTSRCVAMALRELHRQNPLVQLVISYADADQDHVGTIYQATNWMYEGLKNPGGSGPFVIHGKKVHPRTVGSWGYKQSLPWIKEHVDPNAEWLKTKGKHKYLFCFDRKLKKKLEMISQEYPKKE